MKNPCILVVLCTCTGLTPVTPTFLIIGSLELETTHQMQHNQCWAERTTLLLVQPRMLLTSFAVRVDNQLTVSQLATRTPRRFSAELLSSLSDPSMYWCLGLLLHRQRDFCFPLLNFMILLSAQFSSLLSSSKGLHRHLVYQSLLPFLYHLQTCWGCTPFSNKDHERWSWTTASIEPCGILLVICLQLDFMWLITTLCISNP